jgi:NTE family protein
MKTGLILSGGGTHGAIEVGVLKVLVEKDIIPDFIIGTSVGAANAVYFAEKPDIEHVKKMENIWLKASKVKNFFPVKKDVLYKLGKAEAIYDMSNFEKLVIDEIESKYFNELKIKVYINCARLDSGKNVFFEKGDLKKIVLASCSIVPFFQPVEINGKYYMDGGYGDYLGLSMLKKLKYGKLIIVVSPLSPLIKNPKGIHDYIYNSINIVGNQLVRDIYELTKENNVDIIAPKVKIDIGNVFDLRHVDYLIKLGEREARKVVKG